MNLKPYIHIAKHLDRCYFYRKQYSMTSSYMWELKVYMTANNHKVLAIRKALYTFMREAYLSNEITPVEI